MYSLYCATAHPWFSQLIKRHLAGADASIGQKSHRRRLPVLYYRARWLVVFTGTDSFATNSAASKDKGLDLVDIRKLFTMYVVFHFHNLSGASL